MTTKEEISMPKKRVSLTLPENYVEWVDQKVEARVYATRSHAIEVLIKNAMKSESEK